MAITKDESTASATTTVTNSVTTTADTKSNKDTSKKTTTLLFTSFIFPDGFGDLIHLISKTGPLLDTILQKYKDYLKTHLPELEKHLPELANSALQSSNSEYDIKLLICCTKASAEFVNNTLKENKRNAHVIVLPDAKTMEEHINAFPGLVKSNENLRTDLRNAKAIFNFATPLMEPLLKKLGVDNTKVPFVTMAELGANSCIKMTHPAPNKPIFWASQPEDTTQVSNVSNRHMGCSPNHHGLVIPAPKDHLDPVQSFLNISDHSILNLLLDGEKPDRGNVEAYLSKTLVIPMYSKCSKQIFIAVLRGMIGSKFLIQNKFAQIDILLTEYDEPINLDDLSPYIDKEFLHAHNIGKFDFIAHKKSQYRPKVNKTSHVPKVNEVNGLRIRVIKNHGLMGDNYQNLKKACTYKRRAWIGVAGDLSFEECVELRAFPLLLMPFHKDDFMHDLASVVGCVAPKSLSLKYVNTLNKMKDRGADTKTMCEYSDTLSSLLSEELTKDWEVVLSTLNTDHNFLNAYSDIVTQTLLLAEYNQRKQKSNNNSNDHNDLVLAKLQMNIDSIEVRFKKRQEALFQYRVKEILEYVKHHQRIPNHLMHLNKEQLQFVIDSLQKSSDLVINQFSLSELLFNFESIGKSVIQYIKSKEIGWVKLRNNELTEVFVIEFATEMANSRIPFTALDFSGNPLTSKGFRYLSGLIAVKPTLQILDLENTNINDADLKLILAGVVKSINKANRTECIQILLKDNPKLSKDFFSKIQDTLKNYPLIQIGSFPTETFKSSLKVLEDCYDASADQSLDSFIATSPSLAGREITPQMREGLKQMTKALLTGMVSQTHSMDMGAFADFKKFFG